MPSKIDTRHTQIGGRHRAASRYAMIVHRVTHTNTSKNNKYKGVEVRVSREEFIEWFMTRDFHGCSVDRINKEGHYELSNMQIIPLRANIAKDKLKFIDGLGVCYRCKEKKPIDDFVADKRRVHTGKTTICKKCDATREKNQSEAARQKALESMRAYYQRKKAQSKQSTNKS